MTAAWRKPGHAAVITGGASGIGFAAAERLLRDGMRVMIADLGDDALGRAREALVKAARAPDDVQTHRCDVGDRAQVEALRDAALERFGAVHCLMNNAGISHRVATPWEGLDELTRTLQTNLWGVIHGCHAFIPAMLEGGEPGVVINTGSKQGITRPPGNYAYNLSKAGVLAYTESVAHAFTRIDGCALSAHLLVPGFVYSGMVARRIPEKPPGAWTPEQTVEFMLPCVERGDFYILCPDGETTREMDEKRIAWTAGDLIENRPALSRWHPDYADRFAAHMADK